MKEVQGVLRNRAPCIFICRHLEYSLINTDGHDVDENEMAIARLGGHWDGSWSHGGSGVGVINRTLYDATTFAESYGAVASSDIRN